MAQSINAESRPSGATRGELRQMREEGKVPGVVYGGTIDNSLIMVDEKELFALLKNNANAVVQMNLDHQGEVPVMLEEVQRDSIHRTILHVDFREINMKEPIRADVSVEFKGAPTGLNADSLLQIQKNEVEVRCLPEKLPDMIEADISRLEVGRGLVAGELRMPDGVELMTDPNEVMAVILAVKKPASADEAEAVSDAAKGEDEKPQTESERSAT